MRHLASAVLFALLTLPAQAESRGTLIAMAVALLDVAGDQCGGLVQVDEGVKKTLYEHFHEYDIAGLASILSRPLNAFYEDFTYEAKQSRQAFCRHAPVIAASTGYPVFTAGGD